MSISNSIEKPKGLIAKKDFSSKNEEDHRFWYEYPDGSLFATYYIKDMPVSLKWDFIEKLFPEYYHEQMNKNF